MPKAVNRMCRPVWQQVPGRWATDQQQRRPNSQTSNVAWTASGNWLIADVDDWQCLRQECSSPPNIEVLCPADTGERWCRVCTALIVKHQDSADRHAADATNRDRAGTSDDMSGGIQNSLKLVRNGLGCPSEQIYMRHYKGVNYSSCRFGVKWTSDPSELAKPAEAHGTEVGNVLLRTQVGRQYRSENANLISRGDGFRSES